MTTKLQDRLALHTWTLDRTPLAKVLHIARATGWNAVELRRADFSACYEAGMTRSQVTDLIRASGVKVAVMGTEYGWIFAKGAELQRLLGVLEETCEDARTLGCGMIMSAQGPGSGALHEAAANLREAGGIVQAHGLRLAYEFSSAADIAINSLDIAREVLALAGHPNCGLLLDAYHLERSGRGGRGFEDVPAKEIFAFQYSDVPQGPAPAGRRPTDRLPPGKGLVRWREVFQLLKEKDYRGYLSYEAPNPALWSRPPEEVAREGAQATRALLAAVEGA